MALSSLLPDQIAHYVHASLERFSLRAVQIVKDRFDNQARVVNPDLQLATLAYDDQDDVSKPQHTPANRSH